MRLLIRPFRHGRARPGSSRPSTRRRFRPIGTVPAAGRRIGGRKGSRLPSLRTVLAVLPHTALQSLVSTSGMSRSESNRDCVNSKKLRERGYSPPFDAVTSADTMRSIRREASARHSTGVVIPPARVSSEDSLSALSEFSCISPDVSHPTSYLPSHRRRFC